jgi:hypothetical protein
MIKILRKLFDCSSEIIQCVPLTGSPENVGLQKEQKHNTFACHTRNEVRLCFGNSQKGSWQHEKRWLRKLQLNVECSVSTVGFSDQTVQQTSSGNS